MSAIVLTVASLTGCDAAEPLIERARELLERDAGAQTSEGEAALAPAADAAEPEPAAAPDAKPKPADATARAATDAIADAQPDAVDGQRVEGADAPPTADAPDDDDTAAADAITEGPGSAAPPSEASTTADEACLAGTWTTDDLDAWIVPELRRQAQGRRVRRRSRHGELVLTVDPGDKKVRAEIRRHRARYRAMLADIVVSYGVQLSGAFETTYVVADGALVVAAPKGETLDGTATVRFDDMAPEYRLLQLPVAGTYVFSCDGATASLRPADDKDTVALHLRR
jgi:hypothetical protein